MSEQPFYPVRVEESNTGTIGLFSGAGYWTSIGRSGHVELPPTEENRMMLHRVARIVNRAYELGKDTARQEMREALGL